MATTNKKSAEETLAGQGLPPAAENTRAGVSDKSGAEKALKEASYQKSQAVAQAEQQLAEYQAGKPAEYVSSYQEKIDGLLDQILNRGGFSYDFNADPLYQAYKDQYTHNGRLAMQDKMAAATATTGGYGSSYAASAGSQAYQGYLNDLNGKLPELYECALELYQQDGKKMQDSLSSLTAQEKSARAAYEDTVANYYKGLSAYSSLADSAYRKDYGEYQDWIDALTDSRDYYAGQEQQSFRNQLSRQEYELALRKFEENAREWEAEQAAAREKWQAQLAQQQNQFDRQMAQKAASSRSTRAAASSRASGTGSTRAQNTSQRAGSPAGSAASPQADSKTQKKKADYTQQLINRGNARMSGR
jgi:hypothetical protein